MTGRYRIMRRFETWVTVSASGKFVYRTTHEGALDAVAIWETERLAETLDTTVQSVWHMLPWPGRTKVEITLHDRKDVDPPVKFYRWADAALFLHERARKLKIK